MCSLRVGFMFYWSVCPWVEQPASQTTNRCLIMISEVFPYDSAEVCQPSTVSAVALKWRSCMWCFAELEVRLRLQDTDLIYINELSSIWSSGAEQPGLQFSLHLPAGTPGKGKPVRAMISAFLIVGVNYLLWMGEWSDNKYKGLSIVPDIHSKHSINMSCYYCHSN